MYKIKYKFKGAPPQNIWEVYAQAHRYKHAAQVKNEYIKALEPFLEFCEVKSRDPESYLKTPTWNE